MIRVRSAPPVDPLPESGSPNGPNSCSKSPSGVSDGLEPVPPEVADEPVPSGRPGSSSLLGRMVGITADGRTTRMRLRCMVGQISRAC